MTRSRNKDLHSIHPRCSIKITVLCLDGWKRPWPTVWLRYQQERHIHFNTYCGVCAGLRVNKLQLFCTVNLSLCGTSLQSMSMRILQFYLCHKMTSSVQPDHRLSLLRAASRIFLISSLSRRWAHAALCVAVITACNLPSGSARLSEERLYKCCACNIQSETLLWPSGRCLLQLKLVHQAATFTVHLPFSSAGNFTSLCSC